jgi:hypothetical protein
MRRITLASFSFVLLAFALAGAGVSDAGEAPSAPSDLVWEGGLHKPLQLWWTDNSDNEDGFRLYRRIGGDWTEVATYPADTEGGPLPYFPFQEWCDQITLRLVAYNDAVESAPSNEEHLPPPPSGCPAEFDQLYTNDTGRASSQLVLDGVQGLNISVADNALGCSDPWVVPNTNEPVVAIVWSVACVDPGESVTIHIIATSPVYVPGAYWIPGLVQGDFDCDGDIDSVDVLQVLVYAAELPRIGEPCGPLGNRHKSVWFGDLNCDEGHGDVVDALFLARWLAALPVNQHEPCVDVGEGI